MELAITFRGLNRMQSGTATRAFERQSARLERLLHDHPTALRAVVDGSQSSYRVSLSMSTRGANFTAEDGGHDLSAAIGAACERLRVQLLRRRERRESQRHRAVSA